MLLCLTILGLSSYHFILCLLIGRFARGYALSSFDGGCVLAALLVATASTLLSSDWPISGSPVFRAGGFGIFPSFFISSFFLRFRLDIFYLVSGGYCLYLTPILIRIGMISSNIP